MHSVHEISLDSAVLSEEFLLSNLLELYTHDLSVIFPHVELGSDGRFGYRSLRLYWTEPDRRFPFVIRCEERVAGFILVQRTGLQASGRDAYDIAEFFVLRRYRRYGVGRQAAFLLWNRLAGQWTVRVAEDNRAALAFWSGVITTFTSGGASRSTLVNEARRWSVFTFTSPTLRERGPQSDQ